MTEARLADRVAVWTPRPEVGDGFPFCSALLSGYLAADPAERAALRNAVRRNRALWNTTGPDALTSYLAHLDANGTAVESLRAALTACSLTGGYGDWRDTVAWLTRLWHRAVRRGIDPAPHFDQIGDTADDGNVHGASGRSTRGLFRNALANAASGRDDGIGPVPPPPPPTPPCPACGKPLRTARARQCFECGADWHVGQEDTTRPRATDDADATRDRTNTRLEPEPVSTGDNRPTDEPAAVPEFTPGDRYRFGDELARGGMGVVYRATDTSFDREVAIKVVGPGQANTDAARRFVEEARITGQLQHPGIPPVHDLGTLPDGRPFLAMKLIKGHTFAVHIRSIRTEAGRDGPEDLERLTRIFEQVCLAVAFAHSRRVIHRDLKPQNVMVGAFGEVQVMDWGLAKEFTPSPSPAPPGALPAPPDEELGGDPDERTVAGRVMGTPSYMPPEQARGEVDRMDERADVFALGGILLTLLTGRPPYTGKTSLEVWNKAAAGDLSEALSRLERVTGAGRLPVLAKKCLSLDPAGRPAHAGEVAAAAHSAREWAERVKRGEELTLATSEAEHASRRAERQSRGAVVIGVIGFALGLAIAAAMWAYVAARDASTPEWAAARAEGRKAAAKEQFEEVTDAVAHGLEANRFARGWDGQYRQRMIGRVTRLVDDLDPGDKVRAHLVLTAIHDAAQEKESADRDWYDARGVQAQVTPDHPEWELSVTAVTWAGGRKPFGDLERRVLTRAAQVLKRHPPRDLSEDLIKRTAGAKEQVEQYGIKVR